MGECLKLLVCLALFLLFLRSQMNLYADYGARFGFFECLGLLLSGLGVVFFTLKLARRGFVRGDSTP